MSEEAGIPIPVRFSPFKHHRNYILGILDNASPELVVSLLGPVCNNYTDIYTGQLTPEAICSAIIDILKSKEVFSADDFTRWVDLKNGYQKVILEDQSEWIVRRSVEAERYIHIHPTRSGPLTMRLKGSTLKTAYLLKISMTVNEEILSLENVNRVRMQVGFSPVKKLERGKGILKCYERFFNVTNFK